MSHYAVTGDVSLDDNKLSELEAQLSLYRDQALGYHEGELGVRARTAWDYYYGDLPKPITNGSSSWVDRTVWETVNGVVQELSNVFTSGEQAVKFAPVHSYDGEGSLIATQLVNNVLLEKNNGFKLLNDAFKEACVTRNSFFKSHWEETTRKEKVRMDEVTQEELDAALATIDGLDSENIEVIMEFDDETGLGSGCIELTIPDEKAAVEFVPFEQVIVEPTATSLCDTNYIAHRVRKTKDELYELGFDTDAVAELSPASSDIEAGVIANSRVNNLSPLNVADVVMVGDDKADKVWLYEEYITTSVPSGELEILQVFTVNRQILEINRVNRHPFDTITPFPIPGFVWGESVVDITKDIQDLNSFTVRGIIDNVMNANFRRYTAIKGAYDRRSLLDNRPGGVVEIQTAGAVDILPYHQLPQASQYLLEYVEQKKEQRTGVTRLGQGLNPDVFKNDNSTATVNTMLSAAQNRLRMVCRNVANTGMISLMKNIYNLYRENGTIPVRVRTAKGMVDINPRDLPPRDKLTVSLAIGENERKERVQILTGLYGQALNSPVAKNIQPHQHYHWTSEIMKASGVYDVENYITAPEEMPPEEPSPQEQIQSQAMVEAVKKLQAETKKLMAEASTTEGKFAFEQVKTADQFTVDREKSLSQQDEAADEMLLKERELDLKEREVAVEEARLELDRQRALIETQLESEQQRAVAISGGRHTK